MNRHLLTRRTWYPDQLFMAFKRSIDGRLTITPFITLYLLCTWTILNIHDCTFSSSIRCMYPSLISKCWNIAKITRLKQLTKTRKLLTFCRLEPDHKLLTCTWVQRYMYLIGQTRFILMPATHYIHLHIKPWGSAGTNPCDSSALHPWWRFFTCTYLQRGWMSGGTYQSYIMPNTLCKKGSKIEIS